MLWLLVINVVIIFFDFNTWQRSSICDAWLGNTRQKEVASVMVGERQPDSTVELSVRSYLFIGHLFKRSNDIFTSLLNAVRSCYLDTPRVSAASFCERCNTPDSSSSLLTHNNKPSVVCLFYFIGRMHLYFAVETKYRPLQGANGVVQG